MQITSEVKPTISLYPLYHRNYARSKNKSVFWDSILKFMILGFWEIISANTILRAFFGTLSVERR